MARRAKSPFAPAKPRQVNWSKYPRALDRKLGLSMVEDLFDNLTPPGFTGSQVRDPAAEEGGE